ncbi:histone deacetylase family protein [Carboxydothermus hydrogenoformans]|uniref:Histone deacetylase domain protein n=1 Tax=Carboxydothermus hydrogenoformans (strain ATCC BAA-161 / DSM 6008 / Z-2901) TaxID=246194 RepID=Q3AFE9_CARHZ|nr:histone deacetylase [Carboxydothermus hydrogenoformans]ABB14074.1 histone deacetylase domain protein [Carboxydothermus hydrogenoformans Z-2901]
MNKTGLLFFPAFDWAISPTHPEREERLLYTRDQIMEEGILELPGFVEYSARPGKVEDVERVHLTIPDTQKVVTDAHLIAAGSCIELAERILAGEVKNGFALVRPPGHHATRTVYGNRGFCNINNVAITVDYLRWVKGVKKIAIIDTDVHHGDGTQDIFYHDPDVLFISLHQDGRTLYPGTGFIDEAGTPNAYGTTINLPLPPGSGDEEILYLLEEAVLPILEEFQPEFIINSAGQDNHYSDPLARMAVTARGYGRITELIKPDLAVLEGGYSIEGALPYVNLAILLALYGESYEKVVEPKGLPLEYRARHKDYAKKLAAVTLERWRMREELAEEEKRKHNGYYSYNRSIFYDTEGFHEHRVTTVKLCDRCPGYVGLSSYAYVGNRVVSGFATIVMPGSCKDCREEAEAVALEALAKKNYDKVAVIPGKQVVKI